MIIGPLAAVLLQLGVSRQREYLADATAARMLREGRPLADALENLETARHIVPMQVNPATETLYIVNPFSGARRDEALLDAPADRGQGQAPPRVRPRRRHPLRLELGIAAPPPNEASVAPTQDALYAGLDLDLSWSEQELPERERTKHVHRLHPYLGKFIPQLVEALLGRYVRAGGRVLDPFAGSGTTLVQSLESGRDAVGGDIAAFNCLLMRVKTARYNEFTLEKELRDACARLEGRPKVTPAPGGYDRRLVRAARCRLSFSIGARSSTTTSTRTCCGSSLPAPHARRGSRRTSTSTSRVLHSVSRTGATSTSASAGRSTAPSTSSAATRSTR